MDRIEAYHKIHAHFSTVKELEACQYRSPSGYKCAVGVIIPDEKYRPEFDGRGKSWFVSDILKDIGFDPDGKDRDLYGFLNAAQSCHDTSATPREFLDKLDEYALNMGMVPPLPPSATTKKESTYAEAIA